MNRRDHWEQVYRSKTADKLGWYAPHLQTSIDWIKKLGLSADSPIIDVGGGASTLVDDLLDAGYRSITVLDISAKALSMVQERLGEQSSLVTWLNADITTAELPDQAYMLWHDRAVFHFLIEPNDRNAYRQNLLTALQPNGHVVIGTFAPEAPPRCSGLPVRRYSKEQLADELGAELVLVNHAKELHITPGGVEQMYQFCEFRRVPRAGHP